MPVLISWSLLGSHTVSIEVGTGPEKKQFVLHKKLLCVKAQFFDKMFNSTFQEGQTQSATLPEDDPDAFALFVDWLYTRTISVASVKNPDEGKTAIRALTKLFAFAEKYCLISIADQVMDRIVELGIEFSRLPGDDIVGLGYSTTKLGSRLRLYLSRSYTFHLFRNITPSYWTPQRLHDVHQVAVKHPDLLFNFFLISTDTKYGGIAWLTNSNHAPFCDYYQHGKDAQCLYSSAKANAKTQITEGGGGGAINRSLVQW